jgi:putative ABC transport system permease protein
MLRLALRGVMAHKARLALTTFAVVLGVAFVSGTYVFTDSIRASFDDLFTEVNQGIDLNVRGAAEFGSGRDLIPERLVDEVRAVPGVATVSPGIGGIAQLVGHDGRPIGGAGPPTLGFSYLPGDEDLFALVLRDGAWPRGPGDLAVDAFAADANDLNVGDTIDVILPAGIEPFTITGTVTVGDAPNLLGATLAIFPFETAQRVFDAEGRVSTIAVNLTPGTDRDAVQAAIAALLPAGVEVVTAEQQTDDDLAFVDEGVGFINTLLLVIAGVAVFVGAFIIQNTFRIIVAQRTRELALLRAVGATGRQVTRMVGAEALLVGVVASALGIGAGVLLALGIKAAFAAFGFGIPATGIVLQARTVIVAALVGIVVTFLAALLPARRAAAVPPVAALRDVIPTRRGLHRRVVAGTAVTVSGFATLLVGLLAPVGNRLALVGLGSVVTFIGVSMLAPLVARATARVVGAPLPRAFGVVGKLAQENAMRRPRRTAATASALMIGVALIGILAVFASSAKAGVADVFARDFDTDFQIQLSGFSDPLWSGLSPTLTAELRGLPELDVVARYRAGEFRDDPVGAGRLLSATDGDLHRVVRLDTVAGSAADLRQSTALVSRDYARERDISVGEVFTIQVPSGRFMSLTAVAVFDNPALGVPLVIDLSDYEQEYSFRLDQGILIRLVDGVSLEEGRAAIERVTVRYPNAELTTTDELIRQIEGQIDGLINLLVVLLAFAVVIALMGIVNTLALSITERRRELGLLRAVGMRRRQVRRMIRWEAVLIAVFGAVLGLVVGVVLGVAVVQAVGEGLRLAVPVVTLLVYVVAASVGGVLAAILPARRAARLDVLEAIAYE